MSKIFEEFKAYRDQFGQNGLRSHNGVGEPTQNGQLFTMEYLICLIEDGTATLDEINEEVARLKTVYSQLEVFPGTSLRRPDSPEGNSMDNVGAHLVFDALFMDGGHAKRMLDHGQNTPFKGVDPDQGADGNAKFFALAWLLSGCRVPKNFWNNTKPGWFAGWGWYGRSPGFMATLRWMANGKASVWDKTLVLVSQFLGCLADTGNTDARKLPYVLWYWLSRQGRFWHMAYRVWAWILIKQYGSTGIREVYARYYQDLDHPIRRFGPNQFE